MGNYDSTGQDLSIDLEFALFTARVAGMFGTVYGRATVYGVAGQ